MDEVEMLKRAVEIYSPTKKEGELANFLLDRAGNNAKVDGVGNFIMSKGNGSRALLLCSHLDTVPGKIPIRIDNRKLYGRGAVDAKASLISMFSAFSRVNVKNIRVIFAGVVDEEGNSRGIKYLMQSISPDWAVFGEPSGINKITIGYKGSMRVNLEFYGESGHLANPMTKNAIEEALEFIQSLITNYGEVNYKKLTIRPSRIRSSETECDTLLDIRLPPGMNKDDVLKILGRGRVLEDTPPYEINPSNKIVVSMKRAIRRVTGERAGLVRKTGTGDMNIFSEVCKNCITYGPGDSRLDHTNNEHIDIDEFLSSIKIYQEFIKILDG